MGENAEEGRKVGDVGVERLDAREDALKFPIGAGESLALPQFAERFKEAIIRTLVEVEVGTAECEGAEDEGGARAKCGVLTRRRRGRKGNGFRPLSWGSCVCHDGHGGLETVCG